MSGSPPALTRLAVGEPLDRRHQSYAPGSRYQYDRGGHVLYLMWDDLDQWTIAAVRKGRMTLSVYAVAPVIWLLYRIDGAWYHPPARDGRWSDAPYSWHLVAADRRVMPEDTGPETRALLSIILVEAETGIVRALRVLSMSPLVTRQLHAAIRDQAQRPWDEPAYSQALADAYQHLSVEEMVRRAVVLTEGGA